MNEVIPKKTLETLTILTYPDNLWINIVLAVVTFLAVLVALFQERIRKFWNKAILHMEINLKPPDCHQISLTTPRGEYAGQSIYIRIKVKHKKGPAGENVEIIPLNFWQLDAENKLLPVRHFLPISLVWSHFQPRKNTIRIPVGLFRHCDFGHFIKNPRDENQSLLILDTMVQPNPVAESEVPNIIKSGRYQFELLLSGDNVRPIKKKWQLEFDGWSEDESEMLNKKIKIKEI